MIPLVTVLVPTYGRPELLQECIKAFLDQTWQNTKLIIGNDYADQELVFNHPLVTVINRKQRFTTLGEKRNWMTSLATPGFVTQWDDDDIYLPTHIEHVMGRMSLYRHKIAKQAYTWRDIGRNHYQLVLARHLHTVIGHTDVFAKTKGYPAQNLREDTDLHSQLLHLGLLAHPPVTAELPKALLESRVFTNRLVPGPAPELHVPTFVNVHVSGRAHVTDFEEKRCAKGMDEDARANCVSGRIELIPSFRRDYQAIADASWEMIHALL